MFLGLSICAQEGFIAGKLLDAETQEPIVFATIKIKGIAVGVISNMDGGFQIPYRFKNYSRVLEISSMGYRTKEIPISTLWLEKVNLIPLEPELIQLEEAVVKAGKKKKLTVRQMVKKAIANIPKTFSADPYSTIGYYRDYQMEESQYINLNEAILEVLKYPELSSVNKAPNSLSNWDWLIVALAWLIKFWSYNLGGAQS